MKHAPQVVVLGGPNGAGKSTIAPELLRNALGLKEFVNADQIASGLSAFNTEAVAFEAGRIMLRRVHELARDRSNFAFESTLASRSFHPFLLKLKEDGYRVVIFYVALMSPELAVARVKHRVRMGGHDVPEEIVRRRFRRSLMNLFELYLPVADRWRVFDNSAGAKPTTIAEQSTSLRIYARKKWLHLQNLAASAS